MAEAAPASEAKLKEEAAKKLESDKQKLELVKSLAVTFPVPSDEGGGGGEGGEGGDEGADGGAAAE